MSDGKTQKKGDNEDLDDTDALLTDWTAELAAALGLDVTAVDIDAVLGLAGVAARAVVRPAAPLTTFLVGYAAGQAVGGGTASADALETAMSTARAVAAARATAASAGTGHTGSTDGRR
jgi:hypothetical protein